MQLTALAMASKDVKLGMGDMDVAVPDSIMAARNGVFVACLCSICATD